MEGAERGRLPLDTARSLLDAENLEHLTYREIVSAFHEDGTMKPYLPLSDRREDPRNHTPVFYSESRAKRPHSYGSDPADCPICSGHLTRILELFRLPSAEEDEYAFINKNLYPIAYPGLGAAEGLHFLIWPSTIHGRSFRNMEPEAAAAVLSRIALLERKLLTEGGRGYVCLIKNEGARVGGSIEHDHFQLLHTPTEPAAFRNDRLFRGGRPGTFTELLLDGNGDGLTVHGEGIWRVLVPRFMKRPYDLFIVSRDERKRRLSDLDDQDLLMLGSIFRRIFLASDILFTRLRRQPAFNLVMHNSGTGSLYFEFLPSTQELGGFEQLGLYLCQTSPENAAEWYRRHF